MSKQRRGRHEGAIGKRADGRWHARVDLGWENGKRRRKHLYGQTRADVAGKLTKILRDIQQGLPVHTDRQTVKQFLSHWLEHVARPRLRPRTFAAYEHLIRLHIVPTLGPVRVQALTAQKVQAWISAMQKGGATAQRCHAARRVLRVALGTAVAWGLVARNPAGGKLVTLPRETKRAITPLTPDQARALLAAVRGHRNEALYTVALAVGLRLGEALGLTWADVDLPGGRLRVRQALQRTGGDAAKRRTAYTQARRLVAKLAAAKPARGTRDEARRTLDRLLVERRTLKAAIGAASDEATAARAALAANAKARGAALKALKTAPADPTIAEIRAELVKVRRTLKAERTRPVFTEPKTVRSRRTIALPQIVRDALERQRTKQRRARLVAGERWKEHGLVFASKWGTPLEGRTISAELRGILQAVGLPIVRFHDLRHTAATLLLVQGVDVRTIMETLGHSQVSLTLNTYSHVLPALQEDAAARMDAVLRGDRR